MAAPGGNPVPRLPGGGETSKRRCTSIRREAAPILDEAAKAWIAGSARGSYQVPMQRLLMVASLSSLFVVPALAQNSPRLLGNFGQWTAAVEVERGQKLCYAFTRPTRMSHRRSDVFLMVSHQGSTRNEVALAADYRYPRAARVRITVGRAAFPLEADGSFAFAANGAAAVAAFRRGDTAVAQGPRRAGRTGTVTDTFSLRGFTAAYNAINRECPARRRR